MQPDGELAVLDRLLDEGRLWSYGRRSVGCVHVFFFYVARVDFWLGVGRQVDVGRRKSGRRQDGGGARMVGRRAEQKR